MLKRFHPFVAAYSWKSRKDGNATVGEPKSGFVSPELKDLFFPPSQHSTTMGSKPTTTPTSPASHSGSESDSQSSSSTASKKSLSGGAKAGIVIGVLLILAAILGLALVLLRRKKQSNEIAELDGGLSELHAPMYGKPTTGLLVSELPVSEYEKSEYGRSDTASLNRVPVEMPAGVVGAEMAGVGVKTATPPSSPVELSASPTPRDTGA